MSDEAVKRQVTKLQVTIIAVLLSLIALSFCEGPSIAHRHFDKKTGECVKIVETLEYGKTQDHPCDWKKDGVRIFTKKNRP